MERIEGEDGDFEVHTHATASAARMCIQRRRSIFSTGYYDLPNRLNVPGEFLTKVIHYYKEPHPYYNRTWR